MRPSLVELRQYYLRFIDNKAEALKTLDYICSTKEGRKFLSDMVKYSNLCLKVSKRKQLPILLKDYANSHEYIINERKKNGVN